MTSVQEYLPLLQTYCIDLGDDIAQHCDGLGISPEHHFSFAKKAIAVTVNIVNMKVYGAKAQYGLCLGTRFNPEHIHSFVQKILLAITNLYASVNKTLKCVNGLGFGDHLVCALSLGDRAQIVCYDLYNTEFTNTFFNNPATGEMMTQRAMFF